MPNFDPILTQKLLGTPFAGVGTTLERNSLQTLMKGLISENKYSVEYIINLCVSYGYSRQLAKEVFTELTGLSPELIVENNEYYQNPVFVPSGTIAWGLSKTNDKIAFYVVPFEYGYALNKKNETEVPEQIAQFVDINSAVKKMKGFVKKVFTIDQIITENLLLNEPIQSSAKNTHDTEEPYFSDPVRNLKNRYKKRYITDGEVKSEAFKLVASEEITEKEAVELAKWVDLEQEKRDIEEDEDVEFSSVKNDPKGRLQEEAQENSRLKASADEETAKCFICEETYPISEMKQEEDVGWMCDHCIKAMKSQGYELKLKASSNGNLEELIKQWYTKAYKTDEMGQEINPNVTFMEVLSDAENAYDLLGVTDSVVRERVFDELSKRTNIPYEKIYDMWMGKKASKISDKMKERLTFGYLSSEQEKSLPNFNSIEELESYIKKTNSFPDNFFYKGGLFTMDEYDMSGTTITYASPEIDMGLWVDTPDNRYDHKGNYKNMEISIEEESSPLYRNDITYYLPKSVYDSIYGNKTASKKQSSKKVKSSSKEDFDAEVENIDNLISYYSTRLNEFIDDYYGDNAAMQSEVDYDFLKSHTKELFNAWKNELLNNTNSDEWSAAEKVYYKLYDGKKSASKKVTAEKLTLFFNNNYNRPITKKEDIEKILEGTGVELEIAEDGQRSLKYNGKEYYLFNEDKLLKEGNELYIIKPAYLGNMKRKVTASIKRKADEFKLEDIKVEEQKSALEKAEEEVDEANVEEFLNETTPQEYFDDEIQKDKIDNLNEKVSKIIDEFSARFDDFDKYDVSLQSYKIQMISDDKLSTTEVVEDLELNAKALIMIVLNINPKEDTTNVKKGLAIFSVNNDKTYWSGTFKTEDNKFYAFTEEGLDTLFRDLDTSMEITEDFVGNKKTNL